jgi:hypothetical protein
MRVLSYTFQPGDNMTFNEYYQRVETEDDLNAFHQFSDMIFINELNYHLSNPDAYTKQAKHFIKKHNGIIIAAYRLIIGNTQSDFPGLVHTTLELQPNCKYAEVSRWAIHPQYRKKVSINRSLLDFAYHAKELGITHLFAKSTLEMSTLYLRYGNKAYGEPFCDPVFGASDKANSLLIVNTVDEIIAAHQGYCSAA